jgi:hypothetical protein
MSTLNIKIKKSTPRIVLEEAYVTVVDLDVYEEWDAKRLERAFGYLKRVAGARNSIAIDIVNERTIRDLKELARSMLWNDHGLKLKFTAHKRL